MPGEFADASSQNNGKPSPKVTIGLPVYNGEAYLAATLASIRAQTFTDWELIISDNCSTDATQKICADFSALDSRINYFRNAQNLGAAPNYNIAFQRSSSPYFKWADYDDLLAPDFLECCVAVLDEHPDVVLSYGRTTIIDAQGDEVAEYEPATVYTSPNPEERFGNILLLPDDFIVPASGLMRSEAIRKTIMHKSYPSSDEVFLANLALLGRFYRVEKHLFFARSHPRQSTKGDKQSRRSRILFFDTSLSGQVVLVRWLYLHDCLAIIRSSPLTLWQRTRCYMHMAHWITLKHNFLALGKDFVLALHRRFPILFGRFYQNARSSATANPE